MIDAVRRIEAISDIGSFGPLALAELATLVPFDHGVFNQIDLAAREAAFDVYPPGRAVPAWSFDTFDTYLPQNPIFLDVQRRGSGAARRLSEFVDQEQLHRLPLYTDILQPLGVEYQVAFSLDVRRPLIRAFSLSRERSDFTELECAALDLLRPHLSRAFRRLEGRPAQAAADRSGHGTLPTLQSCFGLTSREAEILSALTTGAPIDAIAAQLAISDNTVRKHLEHIYRKLGVSNRAAATARAAQVRSG